MTDKQLVENIVREIAQSFSGTDSAKDFREAGRSVESAS